MPALNTLTFGTPGWAQQNSNGATQGLANGVLTLSIAAQEGSVARRTAPAGYSLHGSSISWRLDSFSHDLAYLFLSYEMGDGRRIAVRLKRHADGAPLYVWFDRDQPLDATSGWDTDFFYVWDVPFGHIRLRHDVAGSRYWLDTSPDGVTWTQRGAGVDASIHTQAQREGGAFVIEAQFYGLPAVASITVDKLNGSDEGSDGGTPVATELRVTTQPQNTTLGSALAPIVVTATDAGGTPGSAAGTVTATLQAAPGGGDGLLTGTVSRALAGSPASVTFDDLKVYPEGTGAVLRFAHDGTLAAVDSTAFDITPPGGGGTTPEDEMQESGLVKDATNQSVVVLLRNSDGTPAALTAASAGLQVRWRRGLEPWSTVTTGFTDLPSDNAAWVQWGIRSLGGGLHRIDVSDAVASSATAGPDLAYIGVSASGVPERMVVVVIGRDDAGELSAVAGAVNAHANITGIKSKTDALALDGSGRVTALLPDGHLARAKFGAGAIDATVLADGAISEAAMARAAIGALLGRVLSTTPSGSNTVVRIQRVNPDGTDATGVASQYDITFDAAGKQISAVPV